MKKDSVDTFWILFLIFLLNISHCGNGNIDTEIDIEVDITSDLDIGMDIIDLVTSDDNAQECREGERLSCVTGFPGICSEGYRECVDGSWGNCVPINSSVEESQSFDNCQDGLDNDCDGKVDTHDEDCLEHCIPDCREKCAGESDGCGGVCNVSNCSGCCNLLGVCIPLYNVSNQECGSNGAQCVDCSIIGQVCDGIRFVCTNQWTNDAHFISQTVPFVMTPNSSVLVTISMENRGNTIWTRLDGYKLGSQNPQDNTRWTSDTRVWLEADERIFPGMTKQFTFQIRAPGIPGVYPFQWRMVQEFVEWFGEYSETVPILVTEGNSSLCNDLRSLAGTDLDASPIIQSCIDLATDHTIVELPRGVYNIEHQIVITHPIMLRTENSSFDAQVCSGHPSDCAILKASPLFNEREGIIRIVNTSYVIVDHIVVDGNRDGRRGGNAYNQCYNYNNRYGLNIQIVGSDFVAITNSRSRNALCGTGLEVSRGSNINTTGLVVWNSIFEDNGIHNVQGLWSDGLTIHECFECSVTNNIFINNTDVNLVFGGCQRCIIQQNHIIHSGFVDRGSFAAFIIHSWPNPGGTSGNYYGSDISQNRIECGSGASERLCGFGLLIGGDPWYLVDTYGGFIHDNYISNAQQGVLIDDAHDLVIYNNRVVNNGNSSHTSCGVRSTTPYGRGTRSYNIDTSKDTLNTNYYIADWDGCIANYPF